MWGSNFSPMHPSGLKQGWNLLHWSVLQDPVSVPGLVQTDVLPPFCATLQGLALVRHWSIMVFSFSPNLGGGGGGFILMILMLEKRIYNRPKKGIYNLRHPLWMQYTAIIWSLIHPQGEEYNEIHPYTAISIDTSIGLNEHLSGNDEEMENSSAWHEQRVCVFDESNIWRKENTAHPSTTSSATAAPRAPVTPRGVHRRRNWSWEQKTKHSMEFFWRISHICPKIVTLQMLMH